MVHHLYYKQVASLYQPLRVSSLWGTGENRGAWTRPWAEISNFRSWITNLGADCQTPQLHRPSASAPVRIFPSYSVDEMN